MKRLGVLLLPPGWDASASQGYPQHICCYPFVHVGEEKHNTMTPARARTRTTRSGVLIDKTANKNNLLGLVTIRTFKNWVHKGVYFCHFTPCLFTETLIKRNQPTFNPLSLTLWAELFIFQMFVISRRSDINLKLLTIMWNCSPMIMLWTYLMFLIQIDKVWFRVWIAWGYSRFDNFGMRIVF